jgi:hypothetical protein
MWLDVAEFVTQRTIPMITKPFNLDKLLLMVEVVLLVYTDCGVCIPSSACQPPHSPARFLAQVVLGLRCACASTETPADGPRISAANCAPARRTGGYTQVQRRRSGCEIVRCSAIGCAASMRHILSASVSPKEYISMADMRMAEMWSPSGWNDLSTASLSQNSLQPLAPGTLMRGRYRIVSQLGTGGTGFVYLVQDENFDARPLRSMKEMILHLDDRQQQVRLVNFKREADVLETLRHTNIPRVYDSFTEFRRAYLVLEYVEGEDLK